MRETTLTYKAGTSDKWWTIVQDENVIMTSWGRTGSKGQHQTKKFVNTPTASSEYSSLINAKKRKGYIESISTSTAPSQEVVENAADSLRAMMEKL